ncbi:MAG TPA: HAD family hydrolase [Solirubrobacteraceae bacterium]|nr:HAD family hydrolase [Solirubrobacteraceae bacterium]
MSDPAVLLDLDGTLVDSVFVHVVTWSDALREHGYEVPMWRIHAAIGMGSDRNLLWWLGREMPEADALAASHKRRFLDMAERLLPTNGAHALLDDLAGREVPFVIATSAGTEEREALLAALGREDLPITGADDVESSKPATDLLEEAAKAVKADLDQVTMIGDSPWDAEAADRLGVRMIALRCGGFADDRLLSAGAYEVVDDPLALVGRL